MNRDDLRADTLGLVGVKIKLRLLNTNECEQTWSLLMNGHWNQQSRPHRFRCPFIVFPELQLNPANRALFEQCSLNLSSSITAELYMSELSWQCIDPSGGSDFLRATSTSLVMPSFWALPRKYNSAPSSDWNHPAQYNTFIASLAHCYLKFNHWIVHWFDSRNVLFMIKFIKININMTRWWIVRNELAWPLHTHIPSRTCTAWYGNLELSFSRDNQISPSLFPIPLTPTTKSNPPLSSQRDLISLSVSLPQSKGVLNGHQLTTRGSYETDRQSNLSRP